MNIADSLRNNIENPAVRGIKNTDPEVCKQIEKAIKLIFGCK